MKWWVGIECEKTRHYGKKTLFIGDNEALRFVLNSVASFWTKFHEIEHIYIHPDVVYTTRELLNIISLGEAVTVERRVDSTDKAELAYLLFLSKHHNLLPFFSLELKDPTAIFALKIYSEEKQNVGLEENPPKYVYTVVQQDICTDANSTLPYDYTKDIPGEEWLKGKRLP